MPSVDEEVVLSEDEVEFNAKAAKAAARKAEIDRDVAEVARLLKTIRFLTSARVIVEMSASDRAAYFKHVALIDSPNWKGEREQAADNMAEEITPAVFQYVVEQLVGLLQHKSMYVQSRVMEKIPERVQYAVRGMTRQALGAYDYE